jgi:hypothetical protein
VVRDDDGRELALHPVKDEKGWRASGRWWVVAGPRAYRAARVRLCFADGNQREVPCGAYGWLALVSDDAARQPYEIEWISDRSRPVRSARPAPLADMVDGGDVTYYAPVPPHLASGTR